MSENSMKLIETRISWWSL